MTRWSAFQNMSSVIWHQRCRPCVEPQQMLALKPKRSLAAHAILLQTQVLPGAQQVCTYVRLDDVACRNITLKCGSTKCLMALLLWHMSVVV